MAKTAKAKTKIQIEADKAREALAKAKEAHSKNANDTTLKAVGHAMTVKNAAEKAENRERFLSLGGGRVGKVIATIETLRQCTNRKSFEFTADDWTKAKAAMTAKIADIDKAFEIALATVPTADKKAAPATFKFE
jgi:hypothetical protein